MPPRPLTGLDLELAWKRAKLDHPDRCFATHPRLVAWVEQDARKWLAEIEAHLARGFQPSDATLCFVPKSSGAARPARVLAPADELVYNALTTAVYKAIYDRLYRTQGDPDIAYQLQPLSYTDWLKRGARMRTQWRTRSREKLAGGGSWVAFADIAGFYDNVDLRMLSSDLASAGCESSLVDQLIHCLRRWSHPHGRGVPQGYSASDILSKLYLNSIDRALLADGFRFLRYVDDYRFFCRSRHEARRALLRLSELLNQRSLTPQAAKSSILPLEQALQRIDGVGPTISAVQERLRDDLLIAYGEVGPYGTLRELRDLADKHPNAPTPKVLEEVFRERFLEAQAVEFDATLFHYVLNRLGSIRSRIATEYAIRLLRERPEETEAILRYLANVGFFNHDMLSVIEYASSEEAVYDYQLYQIARCLFNCTARSDALLDLCRRWSSDRNRSPWLRSYAMLILGREGDASDLERLENSYRSAQTELERADIVASVARMERGRRNTFYASVGQDGGFVARAIQHVRGETLSLTREAA